MALFCKRQTRRSATGGTAANRSATVRDSSSALPAYRRDSVGFRNNDLHVARAGLCCGPSRAAVELGSPRIFYNGNANSIRSFYSTATPLLWMRILRLLRSTVRLAFLGQPS